MFDDTYLKEAFFCWSPELGCQEITYFPCFNVSVVFQVIVFNKNDKNESNHRCILRLHQSPLIKNILAFQEDNLKAFTELQQDPIY